jgi:hypothetical protein
MSLLHRFLGALCSSSPIGKELLKIDQRGCMATDWHVIDRGVIVRRESRPQQRSRRKIDFYIVRRENGTEFDAIVDRCNHNPDREASRFAGEELAGKIYEAF